MLDNGLTRAALIGVDLMDLSEDIWASASKQIASLGIRATEADNSEAGLDTAYGDQPGDFKSRSARTLCRSGPILQ